jgi:beta-lactamase regulating signal transducer with metallopeptidase domain
MSGITWIDARAVSALGWTLVHFVWQGTAMAAILAVANGILRRGSPRARYGAALVTLLAMLALPAATFLVVRESPRPAAAPAVVLSAVPAVSGAVALVGERAAAALEANRPADYLPAVVAGWAAGVLLLSLRTAFGWALVMRLRRSGRALAHLQDDVTALARRMRMSRPVRVCESLLVEVPTAIGWLRPIILLPPATLMGLTPGQLELVLAHELAHIRRLDQLVALLQAVAETLLFYHPAVWWVSHRLRVEREECCDDVAVAQCGNAFDYARTLTTLESLRLTAPGPVLALSGGSLSARVSRLVSPARSESPARWPVAALVLLMAGLGLAAPASLRAGATRDVAAPAERARAAAHAVSPALASPVLAAAAAAEPQGARRAAPAAAAASSSPRPAFRIDELVAMQAAGVNADYVEEMDELGLGGLGSRDLIELRQQGVTTDYVRELRDLGYTLSRDQLIVLRQQGVTPDFVQGLAEEGLKDLSATALVQLRQQGVTPDYARELRESGAPALSALELVMLRQQGVSPEDVGAFKAAGLMPLTPPRLAALRAHGVTADYVQEMKELGYRELTMPMLIALRSHGVSPDYVRELQELGYRDLPTPTLIRLRDHGVSADWVRELQEAGWKDASAQELMKLRASGFQPSSWRRQK